MGSPTGYGLEDVFEPDEHGEAKPLIERVTTFSAELYEARRTRTGKAESWRHHARREPLYIEADGPSGKQRQQQRIWASLRGEWQFRGFTNAHVRHEAR
mmetsp:Transcript_44923/g.96499  ORF Transcript_44923/g.96499 Transcript_44923/m.96499 type:complete len:99 (+) Transcript_44923:548-844(+)